MTEDDYKVEIGRLTRERDLALANADGVYAKLMPEIERLQELLRGVGANRYWEGRWRDEAAENERLRAALLEYGRCKGMCHTMGGHDCTCGWEKMKAALANG